MWPERQSAKPPEEVENVGFEKPSVLLKGLLSISENGLANELAIHSA
jgi:hypothetical protein